MSDGSLWMALIVAGIAAVAGLGYLSRRKLTSNREPMDVEVLHAHISDEVGLDVLRDVLDNLGHAYRIDPKLIRPGDCLADLLKADSWLLDAGTESLNRWLVEKGVGEQSPAPVTVLDLARLLESGRQPSAMNPYRPSI